MSSTPREPNANMRVGGKLYDLFLSFVEGGFSEQQALYVIGVTIATASKDD